MQISLEQACKRFNKEWIFKNLSLEMQTGVPIAIVGPNGSGKSTLLEAIAVSLGFNAEGGTKNFRFGTRRSHSELHEFLRIAKGFRRPRDGFFLRAESFFNVATEIENLDAEPAPAPPIINSYGGRSLHEQSHGESFLALMTQRFGKRHGVAGQRMRTARFRKTLNQGFVIGIKKQDTHPRIAS